MLQLIIVLLFLKFIGLFMIQVLLVYFCSDNNMGHFFATNNIANILNINNIADNPFISHEHERLSATL